MKRIDKKTAKRMVSQLAWTEWLDIYKLLSDNRIQFGLYASLIAFLYVRAYLVLNAVPVDVYDSGYLIAFPWLFLLTAPAVLILFLAFFFPAVLASDKMTFVNFLASNRDRSGRWLPKRIVRRRFFSQWLLWVSLPSTVMTIMFAAMVWISASSDDVDRAIFGAATIPPLIALRALLAANRRDKERGSLSTQFQTIYFYALFAGNAAVLIFTGVFASMVSRSLEAKEPNLQWMIFAIVAFFVAAIPALVAVFIACFKVSLRKVAFAFGALILLMALWPEFAAPIGARALRELNLGGGMREVLTTKAVIDARLVDPDSKAVPLDSKGVSYTRTVPLSILFVHGEALYVRPACDHATTSFVLPAKLIEQHIRVDEAKCPAAGK